MHAEGSPCLTAPPQLSLRKPTIANSKGEATWFVRLIAGAVSAAHKSPLAAHKLKIISGSNGVYTECNRGAINGQSHLYFRSR